MPTACRKRSVRTSTCQNQRDEALASGSDPSKGSAVVINGGEPKYLYDYTGGTYGHAFGDIINKSGKVGGYMSSDTPSFSASPAPPDTLPFPPSFFNVSRHWQSHDPDATFGPSATQCSIAPVAWWWNTIRVLTLSEEDTELDSDGRTFSMNDGGLTLGIRSGLFYWGYLGYNEDENTYFSYYLIGEAKVTDGFVPEDINNEGLVLGQKGGKLVVRKASQPNGVSLTNGQSGDLTIDEVGDPDRITNSIDGKPYLILGRKNDEAAL